MICTLIASMKIKGYIKDINYIKCDLTNKASLKKLKKIMTMW